jgi:hypothetical protein
MPPHRPLRRDPSRRNLIVRFVCPIGLILTLFLLLAAACGTPLEPGRIATAAPLDPPTPPSARPAPLNASDYDIGSPTLTELYISPGGDDANTGQSASSPLRTLTAAWSKIPAGATLTATGYRLNLLPGTYPCEPDEATDCVNQFTNRLGAYLYPVIIRAYNGHGTVTIRGGLDVYHVVYLYLIDVTLAGGGPIPINLSGNSLLHLADANHVLVRGVTLAGPDCTDDVRNNLQEVFKVNQAQYLYVEASVMGGSHHTVLDYFAVQYGHVLRSQFHTTAQWAVYVKGGSAYLRFEGNELHHSQLGFQAGQSSNLPVMQAPWLHYEAYDIKFVNPAPYAFNTMGAAAQQVTANPSGANDETVEPDAIRYWLQIYPPPDTSPTQTLSMTLRLTEQTTTLLYLPLILKH